MKAIILAAGYATRLYPLTLNTPKPLLEIGGRYMIEHIMEKVESVAEIDEVFVVTNDRFYNQFEEWRKAYGSSKSVTIINDGTTNNDNRLGAVGDIHYVLDVAHVDDDVLVIGGDNLFDFNLDDLVSRFRELSTSVVAARDLGDTTLLANRFGVIKLDDNQKILGFEEKPAKPATALAATCVYLFSRADIRELERCIEQNNMPDNPGDFIRYLSEKTTVHGFVFDDAWYDIGSHEQLEEVRALFKK